MTWRERLPIGIYFFVMVFLIIYLMLKIWPPSGVLGDQGEKSFFFDTVTIYLNSEITVIVLVILAGALGACIHFGTSFVYFVGRKELKKEFWWWYIQRPFIGGALALIFYFAFRGVLFSALPSDFNLYGVVAVAGLVGMFSKQAIAKLKKVFDELFVKVEDIEKKKAEVEKFRQIFEVLLAMLSGMEKGGKVKTEELRRVFLVLSTIIYEKDEKEKKEKLSLIFNLLFEKFVDVEKDGEMDVEKLRKWINAIIALLTVMEKEGKVELDLLQKKLMKEK
ncbi:MAG: hypothetical protein JSV56_13880 [Methanomassiliicoccales archaeon]|nr:MAG: hypothetical protein JSV56_13880 [Methanomassiliicoccales archaeon]